MGRHFITLPSMGESVVEATLTNWLKEVGDKIYIDEPIVVIDIDTKGADGKEGFRSIQKLEKTLEKQNLLEKETNILKIG